MRPLARSLAFIVGALLPLASLPPAGFAAGYTPSPCSTTEKGTPVTVTWAQVPDATGYEISKGGGVYPYSVIGTVAAGVTSFEDSTAVPGIILYYCVVAKFSNGASSDPCCAPGGYMQTAPLPSCSISTSGLQNTLTWTPSPDAVVYSIYRDQSTLTTLQAVPPYSYTDFAPPGKHLYCIQAWGEPLRGSEPCCEQATNLRTLATPACQASQDLRGEIVLRWPAVEGATGYHILKDSYLPFTVGAEETTFTDHEIGTHRYGVQAFDDQGGSDICSTTGLALSPGGYTRLSWFTCDPQTPNQNFNGPGVYDLILSVRGLPSTTTGHDSRIEISFPGDFVHALPDAWRFDAGGCQGTNKLVTEPVTVGACPALLGPNAVTQASFTIDPTSGFGELHLTATYDELAADPTTRYVLWRIRFDHSASIPGGDANPMTCDGAGVPEQFSVRTQVDVGSGNHVTVVPEDFPEPSTITWQGPPPVRTQPTTWGHIKGLYR